MTNHPEYMNIASEILCQYIGRVLNDSLKNEIVDHVFDTLSKQFPELSDLRVQCKPPTNPTSDSDLSLFVSSSDDGEFEVRLSHEYLKYAASDNPD